MSETIKLPNVLLFNGYYWFSGFIVTLGTKVKYSKVMVLKEKDKYYLPGMEITFKREHFIGNFRFQQPPKDFI